MACTTDVSPIVLSSTSFDPTVSVRLVLRKIGQPIANHCPFSIFIRYKTSLGVFISKKNADNILKYDKLGGGDSAWPTR